MSSSRLAVTWCHYRTPSLARQLSACTRMPSYEAYSVVSNNSQKECNISLSVSVLFAAVATCKACVVKRCSWASSFLVQVWKVPFKSDVYSDMVLFASAQMTNNELPIVVCSNERISLKGSESCPVRLHGLSRIHII